MVIVEYFEMVLWVQVANWLKVVQFESRSAQSEGEHHKLWQPYIKSVESFAASSISSTNVERLILSYVYIYCCLLYNLVLFF